MGALKIRASHDGAGQALEMQVGEGAGHLTMIPLQGSVRVTLLEKDSRIFPPSSAPSLAMNGSSNYVRTSKFCVSIGFV